MSGNEERTREQLVEEIEDLRKKFAMAEQSMQILEAIMDNAPEAIIVTSGTSDFSIQRTSRHTQELTGLTRRTTEGLQAGEYIKKLGLKVSISSADPDLESLPIYRAIKHGMVTENEEWIIKRPNGKKVPILCKAAPIRDASGAIVGGVTVWRDITELKEAEEISNNYGTYLEYLVTEQTAEISQLREAADRRETEFSAVLDATSSGVMIFDEDGELIRFNRAAEDLLAYGPEEQMLPLEEWVMECGLTTPDGKKLTPENFPIFKAFQGESVLDCRLCLRPKSAESVKCLRLSAAPIYETSSHDHPIGVLSVFDDITEVDMALKALRKSAEERAARNEQLAGLNRELMSCVAERDRLNQECEDFRGRVGVLRRTLKAAQRAGTRLRGFLKG